MHDTRLKEKWCRSTLRDLTVEMTYRIWLHHLYSFSPLGGGEGWNVLSDVDIYTPSDWTKSGTPEFLSEQGANVPCLFMYHICCLLSLDGKYVRTKVLKGLKMSKGLCWFWDFPFTWNNLGNLETTASRTPTHPCRRWIAQPLNPPWTNMQPENEKGSKFGISSCKGFSFSFYISMLVFLGGCI